MNNPPPLPSPSPSPPPSSSSTSPSATAAVVAHQTSPPAATVLSFGRILAVVGIFLCTTVGWFILGTSLSLRTGGRDGSLRGEVAGSWGPEMEQPHPTVYYTSPASADGKKRLPPAGSDVRVTLSYEPKKKGLLRYRTYAVDFQGDYRIENPTPITQTFYVNFRFPAAGTSYENFRFQLGDAVSTKSSTAAAEGVTEAVTLAPGAGAPLRVAYRSRGLDRWGYGFGDAPRVRNFALSMRTDFADIDFPAGTGSPTERRREGPGWELRWNYPDVIGAQPVAMAMPNLLNPGPVATRITFFAPVSLLFFFTVLLIVGALRGVNLHPMNYFFLAAGFFAFQLLFAYLVDLIPIGVAFAIAAAVSLALVGGYLRAAAGPNFARMAVGAQFAYLVLFSLSFFFDGLTGLTITIGSIVTLALLMTLTARVNWAAKLGGAKVAAATPPVPTAAGAAAAAT